MIVRRKRERTEINSNLIVFTYCLHQRKATTLSQVSLYLHGVTSCFFSSPLPESPGEWKGDIAVDFTSLKNSLFSPLWYCNAAAVWGSGGAVDYRNDRGRWAEVLYFTTVRRHSPLTEHEQSELKVRH